MILERIKELCEEHGICINRLEQELGFSRGSIGKMSRELGHSNQTTTANLYTHIFKSVSESSRGIASTINQFTKELPYSCHTEK